MEVCSLLFEHNKRILVFHFEEKLGLFDK